MILKEGQQHLNLTNLIFLQTHISMSKESIIGYAVNTGKRYENEISSNKYNLILSFMTGYTFKVDFNTEEELNNAVKRIMEEKKNEQLC